MADQAQPQTAALQIPDEVLQKFPALLELIKGSESMNNEERQYWINILPVMTPEQVKNLEEILLNEKKQLAAIEEKYKKDMTPEEEKKLIMQLQTDRTAKRNQRSEVESAHEKEEREKEEELLKKIEGF